METKNRYRNSYLVAFPHRHGFGAGQTKAPGSCSAPIQRSDSGEPFSSGTYSNQSMCKWESSIAASTDSTNEQSPAERVRSFLGLSKAAVMAYGSDSEYESDSSSSSSSSSSESSDSSPTQDRSPPQEEPSHHTEGQTSSTDLQGQIRARLQQSSLAPEVAQQILTILEGGDPSLSEIPVPLEDPSSEYGAPGDYVPVYLYPAIQPPHTPSPRRRRVGRLLMFLSSHHADEGSSVQILPPVPDQTTSVPDIRRLNK